MVTQLSMVPGPTKSQALERPLVPLLKFNKELGLQSRISQLKRLQKCHLFSGKWEDLDSNILREIFSRVPFQDLFLNVSAVCSSWEAVCWDFLFWTRNVLDLSATGAGFGVVDLSTIVRLDFAKSNHALGFFGRLELPQNGNQMATSFLRKLCHIMEGENISRYSLRSWRLTIQTIILPYDLEVADVHLLYIAERTPNLKQLLLLSCSRITSIGFVKAIQKWENVTEIHLGPISDDMFPRFVQAIGKSCQSLEVLHIHQTGFRIDKQNAQVIANNLPRLKKLDFESGYIFPSGVATLFNMSLQLEEVNFNMCGMVRAFNTWPGFNENYVNHPWSFRLYWSVDKKGYAKWNVKPFSAEYVSKVDPKIYKKIKENFLLEFDRWIISWIGKPQRQYVQHSIG